MSMHEPSPEVFQGIEARLEELGECYREQTRLLMELRRLISEDSPGAT